MTTISKNILAATFSFLPVGDVIHAGQASKGWKEASEMVARTTDFGVPTSSQTYIVLVRHGETELNAQNKTQGAGEDPSLNDKGRKQAAELAYRFFAAQQRLKAPLAKTLYTSHLKRTIETAEATRARFKGIIPLAIQTDSRLREMEWGKAEGMDNKAKKKEYPDADAFETSRKAWDKNPVLGAETATQVATRAREAITEIAKKHLGEIVLVFTSGKLMRILSADVTGSEKLPPVLENGAAIHLLYTQTNDASALSCVKQVSLQGRVVVDSSPSSNITCIHSSRSALSKQLGIALQVAREAGAEILRIREMAQKGKMSLQIQDKNNGDASKSPAPVTIADLRSNTIICRALTQQFPEYGLLTEEAIDDTEVRKATINWHEKEYVWMVDPLDGTAEFTKGGDGFGVHIALTKNGTPILGVNYYPVSQTTFWAVKGEGAYVQTKSQAPIQLKKAEKNAHKLPVRTGPVMKGEDIQKFYQAWFGKEKPLSQKEFEENFQLIPSMGLVICTIAQGTRNIYTNNVSSCGLWDFASGDVILSEVGGKITDKSGNPINYRAPNAKLSNGVVITNSFELNNQAVATFKNLSS